MVFVKQSTAVTLLIGPFVDDTDGNTAETALTISQADVRLSKNGGNMAQKGNATACTHDELGYYTCPLSTTDTNTLGILKVMVHESGALPVWTECMVVTANVWDTLCSTDQLDVNVTNVAGTAQTGNDNGADINAILVDTGTTLQAELDAIQAAVITNAAGTDIAADIIAVKAETATIVADTNELQVDNTPGALAAIDGKIDTIDGIVDAILVDTGTTLPGEHAALPTAAENRAEMDNNSTQLAAIVADTNELQVDNTPGAIAAVDAKIDTIDGIVDAILADTNELQVDDTPGALAAIDAKIDTIDGVVDTILVDTGTTLDNLVDDLESRIGVPGDLGSGATIKDNITDVAAFIDTEVAAILALLDDTRAEPGQGAPPVNPDLATKIDYLYKAFRNLKTQTATEWSLYNDAESVVDQKAAVSDAAGTASFGEVGSGP